jgi:hypothetical protein
MSQHFTLQELLHSDTAKACGIENHPSWEDIDRLKKLADTLEQIRSILGNNPMIISSGFRCPELNGEVGGVSDSAHIYGYAADFICPGFGTPTQIVAELKLYLEVLQIDQLIDESGWVHVGLCASDPRYQCFKI